MNSGLAQTAGPLNSEETDNWIIYVGIIVHFNPDQFNR